MQGLNITVDSLDFDSKFDTLLAERPSVAAAGMRKVNQQIIRDVKRECAGRGYLTHKPMSFGDAGYLKNIKQYANKDFSGKIVFKKNAYHYKFIEYGANVTPRHKFIIFKIGDIFYRSYGFNLPARPLLKPISDSYWKGDKAKSIMEEEIQKKYDKIMGKL